jgi:hypothetical protein
MALNKESYEKDLFENKLTKEKLCFIGEGLEKLSNLSSLELEFEYYIIF